MNLGRPGMSVLPLGVGDAFSAIHYPTSMLVSRYSTPAWDNDFVLIDCPQSIRKMMREADDGRYHGLDLPRVNTLILTHLHADHASGLETIAAFFKIALQRKLRLVALPEVLKGVPRFLEALSSLGTIEDFFDVVELVPGQPLHLDIAGDELQIESRVTNHPIPTSALRLKYGGHVFSYSADTSFSEDLLSWLRGIDPLDIAKGMTSSAFSRLIVHEVGHGIHTSFDELRLQVQRHWRTKRTPPVRLVHYPDDLLPFLESQASHGLPILRQGVLEVLA